MTTGSFKGLGPGNTSKRFTNYLSVAEISMKKSLPPCASPTCRFTGQKTSRSTPPITSTRFLEFKNSSTRFACAATSWPILTRWNTVSVHTPTWKSKATASPSGILTANLSPVALAENARCCCAKSWGCCGTLIAAPSVLSTCTFKTQKFAVGSRKNSKSRMKNLTMTLNCVFCPSSTKPKHSKRSCKPNMWDKSALV